MSASPSQCRRDTIVVPSRADRTSLPSDSSSYWTFLEPVALTNSPLYLNVGSRCSICTVALRIASVPGLRVQAGRFRTHSPEKSGVDCGFDIMHLLHTRAS